METNKVEYVLSKMEEQDEKLAKMEQLLDEINKNLEALASKVIPQTIQIGPLPFTGIQAMPFQNVGPQHWPQFDPNIVPFKGPSTITCGGVTDIDPH